jgi:predicted O-methyltransferase YrrM
VSAVLRAIEREGITELPGGERVHVHSGVGPDSGRVIRRAIEQAKPRLGCEVGLAFGVSTLYILEAMAPFGGRLVGMDPAQHDGTWRGGGLHNIERSGFANRYEFHEETSQRVLPRLAAAGTRIQFGFVDGWHTFDHTLVDFFYLDQMLDPGGVLVLDDVGYPALRRLAHFILTNRDYTFLDAANRPVPRGWRVGLKRAAQAAFAPLVRDDMSPTPASRALQARVDNAQLIALVKVGNDARRFDHFVPF